jgi:hypothetical protein
MNWLILDGLPRESVESLEIELFFGDGLWKESTLPDDSSSFTDKYPNLKNLSMFIDIYWHVRVFKMVNCSQIA